MAEYAPDPDIGFAQEFLAAASHLPGFGGVPGVQVSFPHLPDKPEISLFRIEHLVEPPLLGEILLEQVSEAGQPRDVHILLQVGGGDFRGKTKWPAIVKLGGEDGRIYIRFGDFSAIWRTPLEEHEHDPKGPVLETGASFRGRCGTAYLVGNELGRGGAAVVHVVYSRKGPMAAKCLSPGRFPLSHLALRFEREIDYLSQVSHPNLLRFVDSCMTSENQILVTELAKESLAERLRRDPPTRTEALDWIRQILSGLAYLHKRDITHRDLSPKNVLIAKDGTLKLSDFGTVRAISDPDLTHDISEAHLGSLLFISDQQRRDPHDARPTDDIFSVGQMAYLLLTGAIPFGNPPQLATLNVGSRAVTEVIESMRAHQRESRYEDAAEALAALNAAVG